MLHLECLRESAAKSQTPIRTVTALDGGRRGTSTGLAGIDALDPTARVWQKLYGHRIAGRTPKQASAGPTSRKAWRQSSAEGRPGDCEAGQHARGEALPGPAAQQESDPEPLAKIDDGKDPKQRLGPARFGVLIDRAPRSPDRGALSSKQLDQALSGGVIAGPKILRAVCPWSPRPSAKRRRSALQDQTRGGEFQQGLVDRAQLFGLHISRPN